MPRTAFLNGVYLEEVSGTGAEREKKKYLWSTNDVCHGSVGIRKNFTILVWEFVYNIHRQSSKSSD